jgi:L-lactate dehydrogenase complex protein LldG
VNAREEVLARLRSAGAGTPDLPAVPREYRTAGAHPPGSAELLDLLTERLVDYRAVVRRCAEDDVAAEVVAALAARGARRVTVPPGLPAPWLRALTDAGLDLVRDDGSLSAHTLDGVDGVVTGAAVAIAETGTIVLDSSPDQGRRLLTLVPDYHLCVVRQETVVGLVPEALARLDPVRPLTFVSGPSATSDIELDRVEGVHGPRTLEVVLATAG